MKISHDDVILDAGCADGFICSEIAKLANEVVGVDIDKKVIRYNQKRNQQKNLRFLPCDINHLRDNFESESFSKIVCTDTLEHSGDFVMAISNFSVLLKKDGMICLAIPYGGGMGTLFILPIRQKM